MALWPTPARAQESDEVSRSLGLGADDTVSVSRAPRPASKVAENIEVITADDIARINAHTLSDVLQTVPGIQLETTRTPGSFAFFDVLGTNNRHIQVLIDGVPQNFLSNENLADPGSIPVQMIERIEIIKGAASAAWGSALGGVINIITKSPDTDSRIGGLASASYGNANTTDLRGELSGTVGRLGYYLTGGNLHSRGLTHGNGVGFDHGFGKLSYELPGGGTVTAAVNLRESANGILLSESFNLKQTGTIRNLDGYLTLRQPLGERLALELQGLAATRSTDTRTGTLLPDELFQNGGVEETQRGVRAGLTWGDADTNLHAGVEYYHIHSRWHDELIPDALLNSQVSFERSSAYLNGTYSIGRLSILPGVRYDHSNLVEPALSYTLGATYRAGESTILRAYGARGYSMPVLNNIEILNGSRELQNIWTVQGGVETSAIPYLWAKATVFYNNIWKIQEFRRPNVVLAEQIRQGVDLELRTSPVYGTAITAGYTYCQSWDKETKKELTSAGPRQGLKLGVNYDNDAVGLRGALTGNWVYWYGREFPARDAAMVWDLHLTQKLFPDRELSPELYFSAHNLFDADQYQIDVYRNPHRWFEGGLRYRF